MPVHPPLSAEDELLARLPLPLAKLYRRAQNAKTPLDRHLDGYYLWEVSLKLLGAVAVVEYLHLGETDARLAERLTNLARPALGHWREFVRLLVPLLAERGDAGFRQISTWLEGPARDDVPRVAGLEAALEGRGSGRGRVQLGKLLDRLVSFRNQEIGHGRVGAKGDDHYDRLGRAFLAGGADLLSRLDILGGRRLLFIGEVRRQPSGAWLVERYELLGDFPRRLQSLEFPGPDATHLPLPNRLYLDTPGQDEKALRSLHPLVLYDAALNEALFLNARRGSRETEYLSYQSGSVVRRENQGVEQRELLARVMGYPVSPEQVEDWVERAQDEEDRAAPAPEHADTRAAEPRRIGEFELLSELGRGAMGVVYRALQPSLGRQVALKCMLRPGDTRAQVRFDREIHALGRVEHPHLVKIFGSGTDADQWFYAMELVEGATLQAVSEKLGSTPLAQLDAPTWHQTVETVCAESRHKEKPLSDSAPAAPRPPVSPAPVPRDQASVKADEPRPVHLGRGYIRSIVDLVRQVAEALHALHQVGVIHRDIKPGNIMVSPDGQQAILMDLGLAQLADDVTGTLTQTREFVGTLRYSSPEQVMAVGRLDARSEVYSLGATLWELLALRPLFGPPGEMGPGELERRIQFDDPEPVRKHHPQVPRDLDAIVQKCLEKNPGKRYATARELAEELTRFLDGRPVTARPVRGPERLWRWCRRKPLVASLLAGLILLLLAFPAVVTPLWLEAVGHARIAEDERKKAEKAKEKAENAQHDAEKAEQDAEFNKNLAYVHQMNQILWIHQPKVLSVEQDLNRAERSLDEAPFAFRHWEWRYFKRLFRSYWRILPQQQPAWCVAFSPDGKWLASGTGSRDARKPGPESVRVWDAVTGDHKFDLPGHSATILALAFSPDSKRLASASSDMKVKVWDVGTRKEPQTLSGHTHEVTCVAFRPDGKQLASASIDRTMRIWDLGTGKELKELSKDHNSSVNSVAYSADGKWLASGSGEIDQQTKRYVGSEVRVWSVDTGKEALSKTGLDTMVHQVAFSPDADSQLLAWSDDRANVSVWDMKTNLVRVLAEAGRRIAFSRDGKRLAAAWWLEINVLDVQTGHFLFTLKGHSNEVLGVAYGPDAAAPASGRSPGFVGQVLASASYDRTVRLWNATTSEQGYNLDGNSCVAFSPDGLHLATAGFAGPIKIHNVETGKEVQTLSGHDGSGHDGGVLSVAYDPSGKWLASGSRDKTVKLWNLATGKVKDTFKGHTREVRSVAFSRDGKVVASGSADTYVKLWDVEAGKITTGGHTKQVHCLAFSPDGQYLASGGDGDEGSEVRFRDAKTGEGDLQAKWLVVSGAQFLSLAFSPDSRRLATGSTDKLVRVWDPAIPQRPLFKMAGHTGEVRGVTFSPDGKRLVSVGPEVIIWDAATGQDLLTLPSGGVGVAFSPDKNGNRLAVAQSDSHRGLGVRVWDASPVRELLAVHDYCYAAVFSPDGKSLATAGSDDGDIQIRNIATAKNVRLSGHKNTVRSLSYSPDGRWLAAGDSDHTVKVWDVKAETELAKLDHEDVVTSVSFSPSEPRLASAGHDQTVRIWEMPTGKKALVLEGHQDTILALAHSPDGRWLASAGANNDRTVRIWDTLTGKEVTRELKHTGPVHSVAFSRDKKWLAATEGKSVILWNTQTFQREGRSLQMLRDIRSVAFSPNGAHLAAAGEDRLIKIWNINSRAEALSLAGHRGPIRSLAFSADGKQLASTSDDQTARVWDVHLTPVP